ncbi:type ISP restriction/modification enzyme [Caldisericum sp.]|uniref:type ISP restriction/modification enzyme n=1 Tax=Caldisericum sp. TaxID=2499687 RepID=UPI003D14F070
MDLNLLKNAISNYLSELVEVTTTGKYTEPSFYPALKRFIEDASQKQAISNPSAINNIYGENLMPDFRITDGNTLVGYIECKNIGVELDKIEETEQLNKYKESFLNLILTNFTEFRLFRNGKLVGKFILCGVDDIKNNNSKAFKKVNFNEVENILDKFFSFSLPSITSISDLTKILAVRTKRLREALEKEFRNQSNNKNSPFAIFFNEFRKFFNANMTEEDFIDTLAQTFTYSVIIAEVNTPRANTLDSYSVLGSIPSELNVIYDILDYILKLARKTGKIENDKDELMWAIEDIISVVNNFDAVNQPITPDKLVTYFYEPFLKEYNKRLKEIRGVFYTPDPVVKFIINSVHEILQNYFGLEKGLADSSVNLLDPAGGTLTFPYTATTKAIETVENTSGKPFVADLLKDHIIEHFYSFEIMPAPYVVGHIRMLSLFKQYGVEGKKFNYFLTNTLKLENIPDALPGFETIKEENEEAYKVKHQTQIIVIVGNPPYQGISANMEEKMVEFIKKDVDGCQNYYEIDGEKLKERKTWLQDDYVKFIRFAQWRINKTGEGVLGFITNHSYLDNPTFRGMRQSLMKTFNEIYILDLHGNSQKKEKSPDGSKDENVFDIQQGVAIAFFVKKNGVSDCRVYHSELWGTREKKYEYLLSNDFKTTVWKELKPNSPYYFFIPREEKGREIYESFIKVTEIFKENVAGIVTARDNFVIDLDKQNLYEKINLFLDEKNSDEDIKEFLKKTLGRTKIEDVENYAWRVSDARQELQKEKDLEKYFTKILYRPFDVRNIFYHDSVVWRTRKDVMRHMMQENLGLITVRQVAEGIFNHAFVTDSIIESRVTLSNKGIAYLFPLYLYPSADKNKIFKDASSNGKTPNIKQKIFDMLTQYYGTTPTPEEIFYYIYAVLYSNVYRTKYAEFLKYDFPRIPFSEDYINFKKLAEYGEKLVNLHLLRNVQPAKVIVVGQSSKNEVKITQVKRENGVVHINNEQHIEGISEEVWNYYICGYQVLDKWLKSREGRIIKGQEFEIFQKIVKSIEETINVQKDIDQVVLSVKDLFTKPLPVNIEF